MTMRNIAASFPTPASPAGENASAVLLNQAIRLRETRARIATMFRRGLFDDSAWDMMLELFIARMQGHSLCVKELVLISGERSTSGLRRIDRLQAEGLLCRRVDQGDHRRVRVCLTDKGHTAMVLMLEQLFGEPEGSGMPRSFVPQGR